MLGMFLEQHLESLQPVDEALGVVKSVDAEDDLLIRLHDLVGGLRQRDEPVERNADRQRSHAHRPTAVLDQQILPVHPAAEAPLAAVDEVQTIILNMKTHHVAS